MKESGWKQNEFLTKWQLWELRQLFPYMAFSCKPNIYVSWSTSELRVRLAPLNRFKPSSKIFYWPFQGGTSFVDLLCFCSVLCWLCFVRVCLYVLCGHLLGKGWPLGSRLWCLLWVCHFPIGILGQVWYLIVSIPDLCNLITFCICMDSAFMGRPTPTTAFDGEMLYFADTCRHIEHMHGGVYNFCLHRFYWNLLFKTKVCWFEL